MAEFLEKCHWPTSHIPLYGQSEFFGDDRRCMWRYNQCYLSIRSLWHLAVIQHLCLNNYKISARTRARKKRARLTKKTAWGFVSVLMLMQHSTRSTRSWSGTCPSWKASGAQPPISAIDNLHLGVTDAIFQARNSVAASDPNVPGHLQTWILWRRIVSVA